MIRYEKISMPAESLGEVNPLADIGNIEYIHAGYETTDNISPAERERIGKGMIHTILPYTIEDNFDRVRKRTGKRYCRLTNTSAYAVSFSELRRTCPRARGCFISATPSRT